MKTTLSSIHVCVLAAKITPRSKSTEANNTKTKLHRKSNGEAKADGQSGRPNGEAKGEAKGGGKFSRPLLHCSQKTANIEEKTSDIIVA